jgi:ParB family chromosome partitioning protein
MEVRRIKISEILADSEFNCRGTIAAITVQDLARDIREKGLLQPIIVSELAVPTDDGKRYKTIAGHRRLKACQVNEMVEIDATIRSNLSEVDALAINLNENIQRQDLNILQEAKAIAKLVAILKTVKTAALLQKSVNWVQTRMNLLELPYEIQEEASAGMLTTSHINQLVKMKSKEEQFDAVKKIKKAKETGEKLVTVGVKTEKASEAKRTRGKVELLAMQTFIRETVGNCLATRTLAWAGGEINDFELFSSLKAYAGSDFVIPELSVLAIEESKKPA